VVEGELRKSRADKFRGPLKTLLLVCAFFYVVEGELTDAALAQRKMGKIKAAPNAHHTGDGGGPR
jgi:hypothetical protein